VRQGPLHFGTSAVFRTSPQPRVRELGLRLLESAGYKGFAQVEFAHDRRDGDFKLLEVNTRVPMWAGVAMTRHFDMARIAYDDLCGKPEPAPVDLQQELWWAFFAKDLSVSLQMAKRRELTPAGWARPYLQRNKVRGVFAADDPLPALGVPGYARSKIT
jgi:predicted ATP-grasp superfamily ATP-dependent carboligase